MKRPGKRWWVLGLAGLLGAQAGCLTPSVVGLMSGGKPAEATGELPADQAVRASLAVARKEEKGGNKAAALAQYEKVKAMDPGNVEAARRLAVLYSERGDFSRADEEFRQAAAARPRDADLFNDWGRSYFVRNRWDEAVAQLRRALELNPEHRLARCNLGLALGQLGRDAEARQELGKAHLNEAQVRNYMAFVYWSQGRLDEARRECLAACQQDPFCKKSRDMMAKLTQRAGPPAPAPQAPAPAPAMAQKPPSTPTPIYVSPSGQAWAPVQYDSHPAPAPPSRGVQGTVTFEEH